MFGTTRVQSLIPRLCPPRLIRQGSSELRGRGVHRDPEKIAFASAVKREKFLSVFLESFQVLFLSFSLFSPWVPSPVFSFSSPPCPLLLLSPSLSRPVVPQLGTREGRRHLQVYLHLHLLRVSLPVGAVRVYVFLAHVLLSFASSSHWSPESDHGLEEVGSLVFIAHAFLLSFSSLAS